MICRRSPRFYKGEWKDVLRQFLPRTSVKNRGLVEEFEDRFASYIGRKHAIATCSGRNGMELILDAMGIAPGDEVIVPAYTLKDLLDLIRMKGVKPVPVDVDRSTFNMDPSRVRDSITKRTRAMIVTHMFGVPCDMDEMIRIAAEADIRIIEDCAHSAGSRYNGKLTGSMGDASFFSFEMTKPINTFGGGMVMTDREDIASRIRSRVREYPEAPWKVLSKISFLCLENVLISSPFLPVIMRALNRWAGPVRRIYRNVHAGTRVTNTRYAPLQALIGLKQLLELDARNTQRSGNAEKIRRTIDDKVVFQGVPEAAERIFYFNVVRIDAPGVDLGLFRRNMAEMGVDAGIHEEVTDDCSVYGDYPDDQGFPVVRDLYSRNIQLPLFDVMDDEQIRAITRAVKMSLERQVKG